MITPPPTLHALALLGRRLVHCACSWLQVTWACRVEVLVLGLFAACLGMGQSVEFLDRFIYVYGTVPAQHADAVGIRSTLPQLVFFLLSVCTLGALLCLSARAALVAAPRRARARGTGRPLLPAGAAALVPLALGVLPVLLAAYGLLSNVGYTDSAAAAGAGLFAASLMLAAPALARRQLPGRRGYAFATGASLALVMLAIRSGDDSRSDIAYVAVAMLIIFCGGWWVAGRVTRRTILRQLLMEALALGAGVLVLRTSTLGRLAPDAPFGTLVGVLATPALFLHALLWTARLRRRTRPASKDDAWHAWRGLKRLLLHRSTGVPAGIAALVLCMLVPLAAGLCWMAADPLGASRIVVAPAALTLFLCLLLVFWSLAMWYLPRMLRWTLAMGAAVAGLLAGLPPAPLAVSQTGIAWEDCGQTGIGCDMNQRVLARYRAWEKRHGASADAPIVLIAAAGGGSRAAAHTVAALAAVDAATCGAFGNRIFAISAVSGGAIGAMLYVASRHDLGLGRDRANCASESGDARGDARVTGLIGLATGDHLSPIINRAVTHDLVRALLPAAIRTRTPEDSDFATRGGMLELTWLDAYRKYLHANAQGRPVSNALLDEKLREDSAQPLLIFNATNVQDGQRVLLSQPMLCPSDGWCAQPAGLLVDATDSARFPLVSPARARVVYHVDPERKTVTVTERAVVDGGYFDNSGVSALVDVIGALKRGGVAPSRIVAILVSSNPDEGKVEPAVADYTNPGWLAQLATSLQTITAVREGRSAAALHQLSEELGECGVIYWPVVNDTRNPLTDEMRRRMRDDPETAALRRLYPARETPSLERAPALGWALSYRSAQELALRAKAHALPYAFGSFSYPNEVHLAARLAYPLAGDRAARLAEAARGACRREGR
jgi:hypothetical protein